VIVATERLVLREMTEADAEAVWRINSDPAVTRYLGEPTLASVDEALDILRTRIFPQYREHGVGRWAVVLRAGGELVGWCGLKYLAESDEYDLGYRFASRHWGHGYATESAAAVLRWAAHHLPDARVVGRAHVDNLASIRVLEKIGLRFEGHEDDPDGRLAVYVRA
jgi:RimJ/RimL family protein N-acetyltransferase